MPDMLTMAEILRRGMPASDIMKIFAVEEETQKQQFKGVGRNEPCPCGSGKKYKKCHGRS